MLYRLFEFHCRQIWDTFISPTLHFAIYYFRAFSCLCLCICVPWNWHIISICFLSWFHVSFPCAFLTWFFSCCSAYCSFIRILLFDLISQLNYILVLYLLVPYPLFPYVYFYCFISFVVFSVYRTGINTFNVCRPNPSISK